MSLQRIRYGTKVRWRGRVGIVNGIASIGCFLLVRWPDGTEQGEILPGECEVLRKRPYGSPDQFTDEERRADAAFAMRGLTDSHESVGEPETKPVQQTLFGEPQ